MRREREFDILFPCHELTDELIADLNHRLLVDAKTENHTMSWSAGMVRIQFTFPESLLEGTIGDCIGSAIDAVADRCSDLRVESIRY